jgi:predicted AAA+ superfamily ATPase
MEKLQRILNIELPSSQSAFLWGARKIGKTTYLKEKFSNSVYIDFLKTDLFLEYSKRPSLLRERLLAKDDTLLIKPIILDEVQKIPQILDEVHWLIENKSLSFILCGSSARKLKRGKANLLGGRAWRYEMHPLVSIELPDLDLIKILNRGLIPTHYLGKYYQKSLTAYTQDYLKEEVFAEGLVRNIPAFSRFFDAIGYSHGELTNYSNIARDSGVDSKTVKEYYQILVDTLLGKFVEPYKVRQDRQVITKAAKFYLFDVGVAGFLSKRHITEERGEMFGKALEHYIFMEILAYNSYKELGFDINFWRTKSGIEVDFILGSGEVAVEIKGSNNILNKDMQSLKIFHEIYSPRKSIMVCNEKEERLAGHIRVLPWKVFLRQLWDGEIIK